MPLEAVMMLCDNSESSRNGDYQPTRFDAQADAINIVFQAITQGNPESSVGLMSMGGKGPEVLTTLTMDPGKILDGLHRTKKKIRGETHLWTAVQVAFLGLKHRQNRSQKQRIIAFACSPPVHEEKAKLKSLAQKLKKNNVTIDFVLFGDTVEETHKKTIEEFADIVRGDKAEGAQVVVLPPSSQLLSDRLVDTPILLGDGPGARMGTGGGGGGGSRNEEFEFGFDPAVDPEMALALRMSMEEEKARQEKKAREEEEAAKKASLDAVAEEDDAAKPLLDKDGQPSGSGGGEGSSGSGSGKKDDGKPDDGDKMDTS